MESVGGLSHRQRLHHHHPVPVVPVVPAGCGPGAHHGDQSASDRLDLHARCALLHRHCPPASYLCSTWQWVSSTIPCSYGEPTATGGSTALTSGSCLVTNTHECVTVSQFKTTSTSYSTGTPASCGSSNKTSAAGWKRGNPSDWPLGRGSSHPTGSPACTTSRTGPPFPSLPSRPRPPTSARPNSTPRRRVPTR